MNPQNIFMRLLTENSLKQDNNINNQNDQNIKTDNLYDLNRINLLLFNQALYSEYEKEKMSRKVSSNMNVGRINS